MKKTNVRAIRASTFKADTLAAIEAEKQNIKRNVHVHFPSATPARVQIHGLKVVRQPVWHLPAFTGNRVAMSIRKEE